jgi:hypothetical protein
MKRFRKLVGAILGGLTAGAVIAVGGLLGWDVPPELAAAIVTLLAAFGTWVAPPNEG